MGSNERRERERQEIRDKIVDAARELFVQQGFEAVSMRKVAEKIEYSATAIYFHFADKEALLSAVCDRDFRLLQERFLQIATTVDPLERLRKTGAAYAEFAMDHPSSYRLMFMTPKPASLPGKSEIKKGDPSEDAYAFVRALAAEAIDKGCLSPELTDPELVAQTLWAGVHGLVSLRIAKPKESWMQFCPLKKAVRTMVDALLYGMAGKKYRKQAHHKEA